VDLADQVPTMENVTNLRPDSEIAILGAGVYPATFGLLAEFGEDARLVGTRLAPASLAGVKLLIVPSGALRNQEPQGLAEGLRAFAETGGQVIVMGQPYGRDFGAVPGPVAGYGWQEDLMCWIGNLYFGEDYAEHPVMSSVGTSSSGRGVMTLPVDGHFTGWPGDAEVWLRRVSTNQAAVVRYPIGLGAIMVSAAYLDHDRVRAFRLRSAEAVRGGQLLDEEEFFRDLVTWLKDPRPEAEFARVSDGQANVPLVLHVTNDSPGAERAAAAKIMVMDPSRTYTMWQAEVPVDLVEGASADLSLAVPFDWTRFHQGAGGSPFYPPVGIWHTQIELLDAEGNVIRDDREALSGRFVVPAEAGEDAWFDPNEVTLSILVERSSMPAGMEGRYRFEIGNQGPAARRLRLELNRFGRRELLLAATAEVAPSDMWVPEYSTGDSVTGEFQVVARVFDADTDELLAMARKSLWFLEFPVAMSAEALPEYPGAGAVVSVEVGFRNLTDVDLSGTLELEMDGLTAPWTAPVTLGPAADGRVTTTVQVPDLAWPGETYLVIARMIAADGQPLGNAQDPIVVYQPGIRPWVEVRTDRDVYQRGDELRVEVEVRNEGEEGGALPYKLTVGDFGSFEGEMTLAQGGTSVLNRQVTVPADLVRGGDVAIMFETWQATGFKHVTVEVPSLAIVPVVQALPGGILVTGEVRQTGTAPLAGALGCRLWGPGGSLEAEQVFLDFVVPGTVGQPFTCTLPVGALERGAYLVEVVASSPQAVSEARVERQLAADFEMLQADLVCMDLAANGACLTSFLLGEDFGRPVHLVNRGDFFYPEVRVSRSLPEVGIAWEAVASLPPRSVVEVRPAAAVPVPFFQNAASWIECPSVITPTSMELQALVPGGFSELGSETALVLTPLLELEVTQVAYDACSGAPLQISVAGSARGPSLAGPLDVRVLVEVPDAGLSREVQATLAPGAASFSQDLELSVPSALGPGTHAVRPRWLRPVVAPHLLPFAATVAGGSFAVGGAGLDATLVTRPLAAGEAGLLALSNPGQTGGWVDWRILLADAGGRRWLELEGGGELAGCGGAGLDLPFTVPDGLQGGRYSLSLETSLDGGSPSWRRWDLDLAGLEAGMDLWTSQDVYRSGLPVQGLGTLTGGPLPIAGGSLHLEVVRLAAGAGVAAPGWPAFGAGPARTMAVDGAGEISSPRLLWEQSPAELSGGWPGERGPAVADLTGDGAADLVVASVDGQVRALRGSDGGLLWTYTAPAGLSASVPAVDDLDGDGLPEVAVLLRDRVVALRGADGSLAWEAMLRTAVGVGAPAPLVLADTDGDGLTEVAHFEHYRVWRCMAPPFNNICFWVNVPFLQVRNGATGVPTWDSLSSGLPAEPVTYRALAAADLDGDGADEVVLSTASGLVALAASGELRWSTAIPGCSQTTSAVVADLDAAPGQEVLVGCSSTSGDVSFLALVSGATGALLRSVGLGVYDSASTPLSVADLDGDGDQDAVLGLGSTVVAADLTSGAMWSLPLSAALGAGLPVADLDGDGSADVLVLDSTAWESLRLVSGATGAVLWDSAASGLSLAGTAHPALGDLDGDGWLEVALVRANNSTGEGAYLALDSLTTGGPAGSGGVVEEVLWTTDRPQGLAATEALPLDEAVGALAATGQLWWRGWLTSAAGQELARDAYPFWIVDGDLAVSIAAAPEVARVGGTVAVSGEVRELGATAAPGVVLEVRAEDGGLLFQDSMDLAASEVRPYTFTTGAGAVGVHDIKATVTGTGGDTAQAWARYRVTASALEVAFTGPEVVGDEPFALLATLRNAGELPLALTAAVSGGSDPRSFDLGPGQTLEESYPRAIAADTTFTLAVTGEESWSGSHLVRFGLAARMLAEPLAGYPVDEIVSIPWSVENLGELGHAYGTELQVVTLGGVLVERWAETIELAASGDPAGWDRYLGTVELFLPEGGYRIQHAVEHGQAGEEAFEVQMPLGRGEIPMAAVYRAGPVDVPWTLENLAGTAGTFELLLSVERGGEVLATSSPSVSLGPAGGGSALFTDRMTVWLEPGTYLARLQGARLESEVIASFEVLADRALSVALEETGTGCGHTLTASLRNLGFEAFSGRLRARAPGWEWSAPVGLGGQGGTAVVEIAPDLSAAPAGPAWVEVEILDGAGILLATADRSVTVRGGMCALAARPDRVAALAGEDAVFPFVLSNAGDHHATCRLELGALEDQGPELAVRGLAPCEQQSVPFDYLLPWDLEAGEIPLPYTLSVADGESAGGERGFVILEVQGVEIRVTSSLDRCHYLPGETAQLELLVESLGVPPQGPVVLAVEYPSFSTEELVSLEAGPVSLSYEIPEVQEAWERIMISVRLLSGRSVFMDGRRVRASDLGVWVCTDRDVYDPGDTVQVTFGADEVCDLRLRDFTTGWEHTAALEPGGEGTASFLLPAGMRRGTHVLEYGCGSLSHMHPYEVRGAWVRFLSLTADSLQYAPGDPLELDAVVESASAFEGWMRCKGLRPDGTTFPIEARAVSLDQGVQRLLFHGSMDTDHLGRHRLDCAVFLDDSEEVFLAQDWTWAQVGDADILGIATDKPVYESGEEGATATAMVFGHALGVEVVLDLDGAEVLRQVVDLEGHASLSVALSREQIWALGEHRIEGTMTADGLVGQASVAFLTQDTIPPAIEITGVTEGGLHPAPVSPAVAVTDHNPRLQRIALDGMAWGSGMAVWAEGPHRLVVEAEDLAGNLSRREIGFSVDAASPRISILGVADGECYAAMVSPVVQVVDPSLAWVEVLLDGAPFVSGTPVGEGEHLLQVVAEDLAGHRTEASVSFSVDLTDPVVAILGVQDGLVTEADVSPSASFSDAHLTLGRAYLDGQALEGTPLVSAEGEHRVQAFALDCAGRVGQASAWFSIDRSPPELELWLIADGACYAPPVQPAFWAWDPNLTSLEAWLDGAPFESGDPVEAEGTHQLDVAAVDSLGHRSEASASFLLDGTPPLLTVAGVTDGAVYTQPVAATFEAADDNLSELAALLDGLPYLAGTPVSAGGEHELVVWASDCAGNTSSEVVRFSLRTSTRPVFAYTVCAEGLVVMENFSGVSQDAEGRGGDLVSRGDLSMENHAFIADDATAGGDVRLDNNCEIGGDLHLVGQLTLLHSSEILGQVVDIDGPVPSCLCGYDLDGVLAYRAEVNDNTLLAADPGIAPFLVEGSLVVTKNNRVTLPAGIYYFRSVVLRNNARLELAEGAQVELYIEENLQVENNARIDHPMARAADLWVVTGTDSDAGELLTLRNHAGLGLMLFAPRADVTLENNALLRGGLVTRDLTFRNHFRLIGAGETLGTTGCP